MSRPTHKKCVLRIAEARVRGEDRSCATPSAGLYHGVEAQCLPKASPVVRKARPTHHGADRADKSRRAKGRLDSSDRSSRDLLQRCLLLPSKLMTHRPQVALALLSNACFCLKSCGLIMLLLFMLAPSRIEHIAAKSINVSASSQEVRTAHC